MSTLAVSRSRGTRHVPALAVVELHPVVLAILDLASVLQCLSEEIAEVVVVWSVFKAKVADIRKVLVELFWEAITEVLDGSGLLLLANLLVLLLVGRRLETLPGEAAAEEVHEDVAESFEIVAARLFSAKVGVDTHVTGGTG